MMLQLALALFGTDSAAPPAPVGPSAYPVPTGVEAYLDGTFKVRVKWTNGDATAYTEVYRWAGVSSFVSTYAGGAHYRATQDFTPDSDPATDTSPRFDADGNLVFDMPAAPTLVGTTVPGVTSLDTGLAFPAAGGFDTYFLVHRKNGVRSDGWLQASFAAGSFVGLVVAG